MDWFDTDTDGKLHWDWLRSLGQDQLLRVLVQRAPETHFFGLRRQPRAIGYVIRWPNCADVIVLRAEDDASTFRTPTFPGTDVFAPTLVSWQYHAAVAWTLRAALTLAAPGLPGAPMAALCPHPLCTVPREWRREVAIRPA